MDEVDAVPYLTGVIDQQYRLMLVMTSDQQTSSYLTDLLAIQVIDEVYYSRGIACLTPEGKIISIVLRYPDHEDDSDLTRSDRLVTYGDNEFVITERSDNVISMATFGQGYPHYWMYIRRITTGNQLWMAFRNYYGDRDYPEDRHWPILDNVDLIYPEGFFIKENTLYQIKRMDTGVAYIIEAADVFNYFKIVKIVKMPMINDIPYSVSKSKIIYSHRVDSSEAAKLETDRTHYDRTSSTLGLLKEGDNWRLYKNGNLMSSYPWLSGEDRSRIAEDVIAGHSNRHQHIIYRTSNGAYIHYHPSWHVQPVVRVVESEVLIIAISGEPPLEHRPSWMRKRAMQM